MRRKTTILNHVLALTLILATTTCEQPVSGDAGTQGSEGTFVPVTKINGDLPDKILAGYEINLNEYVTVEPENATCTAIIWKITDPASVGITEETSNGILTPTATGTMTVTATVTGGTKTGDFTTPNHTITVIDEADYEEATGITGVPERGFAGAAINLGGATVTPPTATYNRIDWTVTSGTATVTNNKLTAPSPGTLTLQGTVRDPKTPYAQNVTLTITLPTDWKKAEDIPMPGEIQTVCYGYDDEGNGLFVAGSYANDGRIAYSADGVTWTGLDSSQTTFEDTIEDTTGKYTVRQFVHVKYLHGAFWAVGGGGHMARSENGKIWTKVDSPGITGNIVDIAWGEAAGNDNGVFVAGGNSGTMSYSTDGGKTWVPNNQTAHFSTANVKAIGWGAGRFLAVGQSGRAIYSEDGIHWTDISPKTSAIFGSSSHGSGISIAAYGGGQYIIAGSGTIALSPDCENWEKIDMAHANYYKGTSYGWINSLVYADGLYVIGGGDGKAAYSADARTWTPITETRPIFHNFHFINGLAYDGKGTFVAVGATCTADPCPNPWDSIKESDHYGNTGCIAYIRP